MQVDPRCHIQSLHWYHESPSGESKLLKTGRNATEPYMHTIDSAFDQHQGVVHVLNLFANSVSQQGFSTGFLNWVFQQGYSTGFLIWVSQQGFST